MKLFLTSSVHAVAGDIAKQVNLLSGNKLVFIYTPAEKEGEISTLDWLQNDRQALVDAGFSVEDYTITGKTREQLENDLNGFDYIYLSGGNTAYLLEQSQISGFVSLVKDLVKKGKVYIGTSAGSIIAGPKLSDLFVDEEAEVKLVNRDGYGFVNFTIVPHWGSEWFIDRYLGDQLKNAYRTDQDPLIFLTDNQYIYINDDSMKIIDVSLKS